MAQSTEREGPAERPVRKHSEFIAALVKDPKNPPEVVEITGFLGAAADPGRTRIYLDTTLQNYAEVMEDKILHVEPVEGGQLGLSHIFIAADAQVFPPERLPRLDARTVFGGAVYQDYLNIPPGSRADIGVAPYGWPLTYHGPHCCPTNIFGPSPCDCPPTRIWSPLCTYGVGCGAITGVGCFPQPPPPPPPGQTTDLCSTLGDPRHPCRPYAAMAQPMTPGAGMGAGGQHRAAFPPPTGPHWRCPPVSYDYHHCASQFCLPPSFLTCPGGGFVPPHWGGGMANPYAAFGRGYDPYSPYQTGY